jgi:aminoglycoside phosphotransferase (APT) family kinase protein
MIQKELLTSEIYIMDAFNDIIAQLEKQKLAIESALAALRQVDTAAAAPEPRVKRTYTRRSVKEVKAVKPAKAVKKSGGISEEGRLRLAEAMKQRWAAKRAGATVKKGRKKKAA